ncbi:sensor histidine kinase [Streptomyces sp. NPDC008001]|uniref:sensor histidine kinase n=1 Tax=Streptomyces sp. NPDC008001 TaxID=3364804 RepID=UPI0036EF9A47
MARHPGPGPGPFAAAPPGLPLAPVAGASGGTEPAPAIQLSALQALCRQVFGFRLAMIALATPFTLYGAQRGWPTWLVGAAVLGTFMGSYILIRDWERFGPLLLRHPALLGVDTIFGALMLFTATPDSPLSYVTICTPLLAGLVYGLRGAGIFACLTILIVFLAYAGDRHFSFTAADVTFLPGVCILAGAVGSTLRGLVLRIGAASEALTVTRSQLAVSEAVGSERARLAREMHDSVAKTLHGLALAADGLAHSADRMDPQQVKSQAELVARSARRAAAESRELLSDLRRESGLDGGVDVSDELEVRVADFGSRTGLEAAFHGAPVPAVPQAVARHLLTIASEAMENAHRHAGAKRLDVSVEVIGGSLRISVRDDGRGLPPGTSLDSLRRAGHFGLVGMVERAARIGARLRIGKGRAAQGTEVRIDFPLAALAPAAQAPPPPGEDWASPPAVPPMSPPKRRFRRSP